MSNSGAHDKFISCIDCPHRERTVVDGKVYDCHDHCEGFKFRQRMKKERDERIRENKKRELGITFFTRR